jgi:hypothetical protein
MCSNCAGRSGSAKERTLVGEGCTADWRRSPLKRLPVHEREDARSKRRVADQAMDLSILREISPGKYRPRRGDKRRLTALAG